jgi:hypothetical protein
MSEQPTPEQIMQVGLGFWPSKVLLSAVEMGLFTRDILNCFNHARVRPDLRL